MRLHVGQRVEYDIGAYELKPCRGTVVKVAAQPWEQNVIRPDDTAQGVEVYVSTWRVKPVGPVKLAWRIADWWESHREKQKRRQEEQERQKRAQMYDAAYRRFQASLGVDPDQAKADVPLGHPEDDCFACEARREILRTR